MKIAFLSAFFPYRGGIAQFGDNLVKTLKEKKGCEVDAFTFSKQYPRLLFPGKTQFVSEDDKQGMEQGQYVHAQRILDTTKPFSWPKTARIIAQGAPDVVIIRYWTPYLALPMGSVARLIKKRLPNVQMVAFVDNAVPHENRPLDIPLTRWFLKAFDAFVIMSKAVERDLHNMTLAKAAANDPNALYTKVFRDELSNNTSYRNILVQPHPVFNHFGNLVDKTEARRHLGIDLNLKTLLFFGFIRDYKGLDLVIDAMDFLDDSYQLVIAGECYGSFTKYQQAIDMSYADTRIYVFNQFIPDAEVTYFFSAADVCVQPYKSATQSGISATAYCFDLPIIVTDVGGLRETVAHAGTGLVADAVSPVSIANAIKSFFSCDREPFVQAVREQKKKLSWDSFADAILKFLQK